MRDHPAPWHRSTTGSLAEMGSAIATSAPETRAENASPHVLVRLALLASTATIHSQEKPADLGVLTATAERGTISKGKHV